MFIANKSFLSGKIAAITLAAVFVFQVCCFAQLPAENIPIAKLTQDSSCHDEEPSAPEAPASPTQSHSCCAPLHSQYAVAAAIYAPPPIPATWHGNEADLQQICSLALPAPVSAKSTGPPGTLIQRI